MTLVLQGRLLGLGSIVRLDNDRAIGLFVVLARGAFRPDKERPEVEPRYLVAPHPYGESPDQETFPILAGDVEEIVFEGYFDSADEAFLADLLDQMENGPRTNRRAQQFTGALTEIPEAAGPDAEDSDAVAPGVDPFAELRRLAGQDHRKDER
ncbi:DUF4176 domain-containing protein [Microbacterium sp. X-17]|uniref:DUF4176 domain-containing protein n=1 Tax=Microbacterium sp. X-17 TaxID=3144404 RepID=UPI0031F4E732